MRSSGESGVTYTITRPIRIGKCALSCTSIIWLLLSKTSLLHVGRRGCAINLINKGIDIDRERGNVKVEWQMVGGCISGVKCKLNGTDVDGCKY